MAVTGVESVSNLAWQQSRSSRAGATITATRVLDLLLATAGLIALTPLLLCVALAIYLTSRGPVLFRQSRTGLNGTRFQIYKFRTMTVQENGLTVKQATQNDKRVTSVGRILRRTSIDELPQLLNVIKGEMSLVGPRPHALAHDDYFGREIPEYYARFAVKPGITGWAQINGARGETPDVSHMERRIELDLWYVANANLWLNVRILLRTVCQVLWCENAY
jgi:exopolysaccharide biosynthesis polyprenyl glycosylphosphotransferase